MNALYDTCRKAFLDADVDLLVDDIRAVLVDTDDYTVDLANHNFLDDVPAGARIAVTTQLQNPTTTGGVFDADDIEVAVGAAEDQFEALVLYKHTGVDATSQLIAYVDTATGLPFTPPAGGISILIRWDSGSDKIFKI